MGFQRPDNGVKNLGEGRNRFKFTYTFDEIEKIRIERKSNANRSEQDPIRPINEKILPALVRLYDTYFKEEFDLFCYDKGGRSVDRKNKEVCEILFIKKQVDPKIVSKVSSVEIAEKIEEILGVADKEGCVLLVSEEEVEEENDPVQEAMDKAAKAAAKAAAEAAAEAAAKAAAKAAAEAAAEAAAKSAAEPEPEPEAAAKAAAEAAPEAAPAPEPEDDEDDQLLRAYLKKHSLDENQYRHWFTPEGKAARKTAISEQEERDAAEDAALTQEDRTIRTWWSAYDKDRDSWHAFALTALIFAKERHEGMTQKEIAEWYGSFSEDPAKSEIALPQEEFRKKISSAIGNVLHGNIQLPENLYLESIKSSGTTKYRLRARL